MWNHTKDDKWWENLEPYPWSHDLVRDLKEIGDVIFCTSPSTCSTCPSQKVAWLRNHGFMDKDKNDYQIGPRKELNAKSGAILIDDSDENIRKYKEADGKGILFPQPWNAGKNIEKHTIYDLVLTKVKFYARN